jgi:hypothetical protein
MSLAAETLYWKTNVLCELREEVVSMLVWVAVVKI